jgi:hypothetical protein
MLKNLVDDAVSVAAMDDAILDLYPEFATPVDEILRDPDVSRQFQKELRTRLGTPRVDAATVNWRLLTLRKRGEDKGGLPKLQRRYNGRKVKPR